MRFAAISTWIAASAILASCGQNTRIDRNAAISRMESYFDAVERGNPNEFLTFYDPSIFETKPREQWLAELQVATTKLGSYKSHRLLVAQTQEGILDKSAGSAVTLTYFVQYERSSATAVFTLRVPSGGKEARIIAHSATFQPIKH